MKPVMKAQPTLSQRHDNVDEFVDDYMGTDATEGERYAQFVLFLYRLPAIRHMQFYKQLEHIKLYCTHQSAEAGDVVPHRYCVVGASRFGEITLYRETNKFGVSALIKQCSEWSNKP